MGNLVADRCRLLRSAADRELVWFIQHMSWAEQGLAGFVSLLLERFGDEIGTSEMREMKIHPSTRCNSETVRLLRRDFDQCGWDVLPKELLQKRSATCQPECAGAVFLEACRLFANDHLEDFLTQLCLNPKLAGAKGELPIEVWYFQEVYEVLRLLKSEDQEQTEQAVAVTNVGEMLCDALAFTAEAQCFSLISGHCGRGKSFASKAWCDARPGSARYFRVPASNDDKDFFRELAVALGVSANLQAKMHDSRERCERVLESGDLLLCCDEAHQLWPTTNLRERIPSRIMWLMAMADRGVPIAIIVTPQFFTTKDRVEQCSHWNSEQLRRRFRHAVELPFEISREGLLAVAAKMFPAAPSELRAAIVDVVAKLRLPLDMMDAIAKRAAVRASKAGRDVNGEDVSFGFKFAMASETTLAALCPAPEPQRPARRRSFAQRNATPPKEDAGHSRGDRATVASGSLLGFSDRNARPAEVPVLAD